MADEEINTGGGMFVGKDVYTAGGDFVGRDQHIHINYPHIIASSVPLIKPPRTIHFTGRESEVAQVMDNLYPGKIITLCGPGGIGKSALAAEIVWKLSPDSSPSSRFPDGIIYYSFYEQAEDGFFKQIANVLGTDSKPTPQSAALRALSGKQILLVLDGTELVENLEAIVNVRGECGVLITSRKHSDAFDTLIDVMPLSQENSLEILNRWSKPQLLDHSTAQSICDIVGRLPLALRLAGRYMREAQVTSEEYANWLSHSPLEALNQGERQLESVPILLERSLKQLNKDDLPILSMLGILGPSCTVEEITQLIGVHQHEIRRTLGRLVNFSFLNRLGNRYEVTHALIRTFINTKLPLDETLYNRLQKYVVSYINSKKQLYFLHTKDVMLKDGRIQRIFFFGRALRPGEIMTHIPEGWEIIETKLTYMPVLAKIRK